MIAARLDRLPPAALDLLQAAAVIGDDSPVEVLRTVADTSKDVFREQMAALTEADLLYETGSFRAPVFRFRHALLRDVAYRRMLRSRRRAVHGLVVEAVERLYPTRLAEHVERLAEHAYQADLWDKAARYQLLACTRAASRWANAQAIQHLDRGIEVLNHMAPTPERDQLAIDLRLRAIAPLLPMGDHERVIALLGEAEEFARARQDKKRLARIYNQLGTAFWATARYDRAMQAAEQARSLAVELDDLMLSTASRYSIGIIHHALGDLRRALSVMTEVAADLSGPLAKQRFGWAGYPSVFARTFMASICAMLGRFDQADRLFSEGQKLADELQHAYSQTMIYEEYGFYKLLAGEAAAARRALEFAMDICRQNEVLVMHAPIAARLGVAMLECGDVVEGRALLEDALARETYRSAAHYGLDYLLIALADARLKTGDLAAALEMAERAEQMTRSLNERAYHLCALVQLGDVLAALPEQLDRAEAVYLSAIERARDLGMPPFEALALQGKSRVFEQRRERQRAIECLDAARTLWERFGAPARLSQVAERRAAVAALGS